METMGKRIAALRKRSGMTQEQLASMLGVSAQAVSKWENDISSPDISLIPRLAQIFGVSTDELLGSTPMSAAPQGKAHNYKKEARSDAVGFGILLIILGVAFFLDRAGISVIPGVSIWSVVWPAVLMAAGISWTVKHFSVFSIAVALLGLYFLLVNLGAIENTLTWSVIWPILLVLLGVSILMGAFKKHAEHGGHGEHFHGEERKSFSAEEGFVRSSCSFGEDNQAPAGALLKGADITVSFGKSAVDLSGFASVEAGAVIKLSASFGELVLILPRDTRAESRISKSFATIDETPFTGIEAHTVILEGACSFGTIRVRYA